MKIFLKTLLLVIPGVFLSMASLTGQDDFEHWHHQGGKSEYPTGIRSDEWYATSPGGKPRTVIVAVLDSGIDIDHPDLKDNIWVNEREIPGNKTDDDQNGYIDDIHGWNFIGGPDGRSVIKESFEVTRLYGLEKSRWENVDPGKVKGKKKKEFEAYLEKKELVESKIANAKAQIAQVKEMEAVVLGALMAAQEELKGDSVNVERLEKSENEEVKVAAQIIRNVEEQGVQVESIEWLMDIAMEQFAEQLKANETIVDYSYNPDFDSRSIVGDRYEDFDNPYYGNNQVSGEFSFHGTHVAGIIGAVRNNDEGMNGIADHVAIMCVKLVPDGDERDKDVANGIRYAVDNGAQIINMSFGKGFSPEKHLVDDAMKYAAKHDVLLVLGAGNEGSNLDKEPKFPNDTYRKKPLFGPKRAPNLISVGALSPEGGETSIAEFSNYGRKEVDVFAPGVYIYSTTPDSSYDYASGTSMAAPVVSGVAAVIRSRYPDLSARQVKDIIIQSTRKLPERVTQPGTFDQVPSSEVGIAGIVDLVSAMKLAAKTKGKAKKHKRMPASDYVPASSKA